MEAGLKMGTKLENENGPLALSSERGEDVGVLYHIGLEADPVPGLDS